MTAVHQHPDFETFLKEKLREHNVNLKKLSELSGIAVKHLENLCSGRFEKLPAAPYMRGYLIRLGELLGFDGEEQWEVLRREGLLRGSGPKDTLPENRFAHQPFVRIAFIAGVAIIALGIGILTFPRIVGRPSLVVTYPETETTVVLSDIIVVRGTLDGKNTLIINGERVPVEPDGSWQKSIALDPGVNTMRITALKFLGRETSVIRRVIFTPQTEPAPADSTSPDFPVH